MPTLLARTFAFLNNIKPPANSDLPTTTGYTITNPDVIQDLQPQPNHRDSEENGYQLEAYRAKPDMTIWKAAEQGDLAALQYYIRHTTSVDPTTLLNTRDPESDCTLLHLVISNSKNKNVLPIIQLMLEHGADATARNVYNVQAIHMVALHCPNPLACMEALLNNKASPNARDGDGWTPMHYVARFCSPPEPVLELLINRGADVNLTDAGCKSPLFGLLANGDLPTTLEWLIHTVKANAGMRGDFLDPVSRKTRPGTIVLQAAKYGRVDCLSFLIRSSVAMDQLKHAVDRDELEHAAFLVNENKRRLAKSSLASDQKMNKFEMVLQLLQELEDLLEKEPDSLINNPKTLQKVTIDAEPKQQNTIKRRHSSFMTMLGSMRKNGNNQAHRKSSTTNQLLRKMSRIIRRTKSENNAHNTQESANGRSQGNLR